MITEDIKGPSVEHPVNEHMVFKTAGQYLFKTRDSRWCYSSVTYVLLLHLTGDVWDSNFVY